MAKTLDQLLGYKNHIGIIQSTVGGVPMVWDQALMGAAVTKRCEGDTAEWDLIATTRKNAKVGRYGSASTQVEKQSLGQRTAKMISAGPEHIFHNMTTLNALRNFDNPEHQRKGAEEVDRQTVEFKRRFDNLRVSALNSLFRYGKIYVDGAGNFLHSSSGAVITADFQVPANNQNQLNGVIAASWATAGTSILKQLVNLQKVAVQTTGLPLVRAYYGSAVPSYFLNNTEIKELLKTDSGMAGRLRQSEIPTGFGIAGLEWKPLWQAFHNDANDTVREMFPEDFVVFMPAVSSNWYQWTIGSSQITRSLNPSQDAAAALAQFETVYGAYSFCTLNTDPAGIKHVAGDVFLPVLTNPSAIFLADVAF